MVLATKLKNIKPVTKLICWILVVILAFGSLFYAIDVGTAFCYFESPKIIVSKDVEKDGYKVYDSPSFAGYVSPAVWSAKSAYNHLMTDDVKAFLLEHKDEYIQKGLSEYAVACRENEGYLSDAHFYYTYEVDYNNQTIVIGDDYDNPQLSVGENAIKKHLEDSFNSYLNNEYFSDNNDSSTFDEVVEGVYYFIKNNDTNKVYTNASKDISIDSVKKKDFYYIFTNGKVTSSKEMNSVLYGEEICNKNENIDFIVYLDTSVGVFTNFSDMYNTFKNKNLLFETIMAILLAIMFIILSIFLLNVSGKKKEDGKVGRSFVDYIPFEVHFLLTGSVITGLIALVATTNDCSSPYRFLLSDYLWERKICTVLCVLVWLALMEWVSSIIRNAKSGRPFYKNVFVAWAAVTAFKGTKNIVQKTRKLIEYKPDNFKKSIVWFLAGYGAINAILFVFQIIWSCFSYKSALGIAFAIINIILLVGINIASVIFVSKYVISLDTIISSAHNHTTPNVDYNTLPNSLKLLVDSINNSQQELQQAVSKAVKDERMRTELITNVSHDLRTPLTSVINYVDLLKQCDITDETAIEYIDVLEEKGNRLKRLIDDLIEASKLSSGIITLNMVTLNLSELATQAVVEHQKDFEENNLSLVFKGDKNNVMAFSDGAKTYRVIENLLSNARKYSAKGTRVYADVYSEGDTSVFEIKNVSSQPLDITPQELIERFVRGDSSRNTQGNGLGLSIADNLCSAMNGMLEISIDGDLFKARVILNTTE